MKDAAVLRILEVAGYAQVPKDFYESVLPTWSFN